MQGAPAPRPQPPLRVGRGAIFHHESCDIRQLEVSVTITCLVSIVLWGIALHLDHAPVLSASFASWAASGEAGCCWDTRTKKWAGFWSPLVGVLVLILHRRSLGRTLGVPQNQARPSYPHLQPAPQVRVQVQVQVQVLSLSVNCIGVGSGRRGACTGK